MGDEDHFTLCLGLGLGYRLGLGLGLCRFQRQTREEIQKSKQARTMLLWGLDGLNKKSLSGHTYDGVCRSGKNQIVTTVQT